ncbi:cytochrome P450 3A12-like [Oppia nitens]|uniref:cytochrome P450 3A12-like n=1 Tax=Oppia nitens TaxID=1686743 RepID=UPI0023DC1ACA|nr:cytochrome P450 3A12-like [Oppia nitens]
MLQLIVFIITFIVLIIAYLYHKWTFWKRQDIPTDQSSRNGQIIHLIDQKCHQKYGRIVGYYEGIRQCLSITDPNLIRKVLVTEFHKFANHRDLTLANEPLSTAIFFQPYHQWRRIRAILSPFFTTGQLKSMKPIISKSLDLLIDKLKPKAEDNEILDFRLIFDSFTFDVISKTTIGVDTDAINRPIGNQLFESVKSLIHIDMGFGIVLAFLFPKVQSLLNISFFNTKSQYLIVNTLKRVINERIANKVDVKDLLQMTIDASVLSNKDNKNKSFKKLTKQEIYGQSLNYLAAGYETTATQLCFLCQYLALYSNYQKRLVDEIKSTFDDMSDISYDKLMKIPFLDAFIKEVQRINCSVSRIERVVIEDVILDGIYLPKGTPIIIPIYAVHMDPDFYDEPNQFRPERWLPNSDYTVIDYTHLPFAVGPRNCIGMKFAVMEMKYAIVSLLINFEFVATDDTEKLIYDCNPSSQIASPKHFWIQIKKRCH